MKTVAVLPPIKTQLRTALLNIAVYKEISTSRLIEAARALPGGTKVAVPDRLTAIALLLGTRTVELN